MAIGSYIAEDAPKQNDFDHPSQENGSSQNKRRRIGSAAGRWLIPGILALSAAGMTGCTLGSSGFQGLCNCECIDDFMVDYRNRAMAEKAWHCRKHTLCVDRYAREYKDGFIQGYLDVASGGHGCLPTIAPKSYLGWQYQSAGGHLAVNAWFAGFPQGAKAAEQDGVGNWYGVPTNSFQRQAPLPAAFAPAAISDDDQPALDNPFYSDEDVIPTPDPDPSFEIDSGDGDIGTEVILPGEIEQIEVPASPDEADSVFDGLFPPLRVGDTNGTEVEPDAVVAEGSDSSDVAEDSLPFSFE